MNITGTAREWTVNVAPAREIRHTEREAWLMAAVELLSIKFATEGFTIPKVRVSCGFPVGDGSRTGKVIGQCWNTSSASDGISQLFVSPTVENVAGPQGVLATLTHELCHAIDNCQNGHKAAFRKIAKKVGLGGKMTCTHAPAALRVELRAMHDILGAYPHGRLSTGARKIQGTRMLKVWCPESGYILRTTAKWLAEYGAPICPCCQDRMEIAA